MRFIVDGDDLIARLWNDLLGLDPDDILGDSCPLLAGSEPKRVIVARCSCGVVGCGDEEAGIAAVGQGVEWTVDGPRARGPVVFRFDAADYEAEVRRALADTEWETPDRTAARLIRVGLDAASLGRQGFAFVWASGRVRKELFTVSLRLVPGPYQVLVHLRWRGQAPEAIAEAMLNELSRPPADWREVEWSPQVQDLGRPPGAGRGWRPL